jgi:hypothetical protein
MFKLWYHWILLFEFQLYKQGWITLPSVENIKDTKCHTIKYVLEPKHLPEAFTSPNTATEKSDVTKNDSLLVFLFI